MREFLVFRNFMPFFGDLGEYSFFSTCIYFIIMRIHFLCCYMLCYYRYMPSNCHCNFYYMIHRYTSWYVISDTGTCHTILDIWYLTPVLAMLYLTLDIWHRYLSCYTWHLIYDTGACHAILDISYMTLDIWPRYLPCYTWHLISDTSTWHVILDT